MNRRSLLSVVAALPLIGRMARAENERLPAEAPGAEIVGRDWTVPNQSIDRGGSAHSGDRLALPGYEPARRDVAHEGARVAPNATLIADKHHVPIFAGTAISSSDNAPRSQHFPGFDRIAGRGGFSVLDFGAKGDGLADDTVAILAAISAAGVDGEVIFPGGSAYVISHTLRPLAGQTWWGYGATLKRADEVSAKTSTSVSAGSQPTTLAFAFPHPFTVGETIAIFHGSDFDPRNHTVQAVSPLSIAVGGEFASAFPAGGTVVRSISMVLTLGDAPGVRILGLCFDGNRANNASLQKWQLTSSLQLGSERSIVRDCTFLDAQADAIIILGDGSVAENNTIRDSTGNGIHLSTGRHIRVVGNTVKNCNLGGPQVGHADGCIIASDAVFDAYIAGNFCENGISGIGSWDQADNSSLICVGNVIRNCTVSALDMLIPRGENCGRIVFAQNLVYDSGVLMLNQVDENSRDGVGPRNVIVSSNYLENTGVTLRRCWDVSFTGNVMNALGETESTLVEILGGAGILIADNQLRGGGRGVVLKDVYTDVAIRGNTLRDQYRYGISLEGDAGGGMRISSNTITSDITSLPNWYGIGEVSEGGGAGTLIDDNVVEIRFKSDQAAGIIGSRGGKGSPGSVFVNNLIRAGSADSIAMRFHPKSRNNVAQGNLIRGKFIDEGMENSVKDTTMLL